MMSRLVLLNPGPVTLTETVRSSLTLGDLCHREQEFAELTQSLNADLARVYSDMSDQFQAVTITGSGTCAVESMLATFAPSDRRTLVVANGVYGERMAQMLKAHRKPHAVLQCQWTDALDLDAVRDRLRTDSSIAFVATVHHETTTGRLNDIGQLAEICRKFDVMLLLDAVSSFGAEHIDGDAWPIAAIAATANKCLHGVPGMSFVLARKSQWKEVGAAVSSVYMDLRKYHDSQFASGYSPFTQSVQVAFALRAALDELEQSGGWVARRTVYRERARRIYTVLSDAGIKTVLKPDAYSCVLCSYRLPVGVEYADVHDSLKRDGFIIYAGQGDFAKSVFRIANMGDITEAEMDRLCVSLRDVLKPGAL